MHKIYFLILCFIATHAQAQYLDYIGAGHSAGVTTRASSLSNGSNPQATISGKGMTHLTSETARRLAQSTFGVKRAYIDQVVNQGYGAWLEEQFNKPPTYIVPKVNAIWDTLYPLIRADYLAKGEDTSEIFGPWAVHFNYAFWDNNMKNEDLLRQRVAEALSEILVVSHRSQIGDWALCLGSYYDILIGDAFSDYKTILKKITYHPAMAYYLSHLNNPKTDVGKNIRPDENYAREIMQLFTIGLYEMNRDGTYKLNGTGQRIPTYDNIDIREMAKIFTGLGAGAKENWVWWIDNPEFGLEIYGVKKDVPLKMYPNQHEQGSKTILKTTVTPANQTGDQDIDQAISVLVNHPNTGPFLARKLIQRMVTSNPSPAYIKRVADAYYTPNSSGKIGDMKNIIRAILTDVEAQNIPPAQLTNARLMRPPFLKALHFARAMDLNAFGNYYWHNSFNILDDFGQSVLGSPTVFNFYSPDHTPLGPINDANLVAPEFKLHNSAKAISYINAVHGWTLWNTVMWDWEGTYLNIPNVTLDITKLLPLASNPEKLIQELDILLTSGQLSTQTKSTIKQAIIEVRQDYFGSNTNDNRVRLALYLILISPDYNTVK